MCWYGAEISVSFVKCHPCTSETLSPCPVCPCGVWGNLTSPWERQEGEPCSSEWQALSCVCVWVLPRLCSLLHPENPFMRFKWGFWSVAWADTAQWTNLRESNTGVFCRTEHSWPPTILFCWIPKFLILIHFSFGIFSFLKRCIVLEKE